MIINASNEQSVKSSGKMRTSGFNMKASAKGFRIISTTLYKDPILAIVRELICNAWDAHQENGNVDTPFEVHAPTDLEPWFSVKDYGIGMSDKTVFGVYTTVFDSTKDQSNDAIGAMGLGSKTPFSYNDGQSFTVTSIHDGLKSVYTAYLDKGEPAITCMVEPHETDEPSGVEVKVPVNKSDFYRFSQRVADVCKHFSKPAASANVDVDANFKRYDGYYTKEYNGYGSSINAVMGNVAYPINRNLVEGFDLLNDRLRNCHAYIEFNIGDLDVAASREELHYDSHTIENINEAIETISNRLVEDAQNEIDNGDFDTIRKAYVYACGRYTNSIVKELTYNGKSFVDWKNELIKPIPGSIHPRYITVSPQRGNKSGVARRTDIVQPSSVMSPNSDYATNPYTVIVDDLRSGGVGITNEYVKANHKRVAYYHANKHTTHGIEKLYDRFEDGELLILKTSELKDKYKPAPRPRKNYVKPTPAFIYDVERGSMVSHELDASEIKNGNIVYAELHKDCISANNRTFDRDDFLITMARLHNVDNIVVVRSAVARRLAKNPNATRIEDIKVKLQDVVRACDVRGLAMDQAIDYVSGVLTHGAWDNKAFLKHFGFNRPADYYTCNRVYRTIMILSNDKRRESIKTRIEKLKTSNIDRMMALEKDKSLRLAFNLVDRYTNGSDVSELLSILRKK